MDAKVMEQTSELAKSIAGEARTIEDLNGVMRTLMKSALEQMLGAELTVHLQEEQAAATPASNTAPDCLVPVTIHRYHEMATISALNWS